MRALWLVPLVVGIGLAVLLLGSPIDPVAWHPAAAGPLDGRWAPDRHLQRAELLGAGRLSGPEDVEVDAEGRVYCGLADGTIARLSGSEPSAAVETVANTGGRPLGLDSDGAGTLWIADRRRGLLSLDPQGGLRVRAEVAAGSRIGFADDVAAGSDGRIYLSDASSRFGPDELHLETLEARPHGRLLQHDPATGETRVLLERLYFANGVAVSLDARFVLVAETFRYRIRRLWLSGPRIGRDEILIDRLPGFPDGVSATRRGTFWVALYAPRSEPLDRLLHPRPCLKRLVATLPAGLLPRPRPYGLVVEIDADGRVVRSLHDPAGEQVRGITSVEEVGDSLYLGSVEATAVARYRPL